MPAVAQPASGAPSIREGLRAAHDWSDDRRAQLKLARTGNRARADRSAACPIDASTWDNAELLRMSHRGREKYCRLGRIAGDIAQGRAKPVATLHELSQENDFRTARVVAAQCSG